MSISRVVSVRVTPIPGVAGRVYSGPTSMVYIPTYHDYDARRFLDSGDEIVG